MIKFKEEVKKINVKPSSKTNIEYEFEGDFNDIQDYETDCSCTNVKISGKKLSVTYSSSESGKFARITTLYLHKKDTPLYVWDKEGNKIRNPELEKILLLFYGEVK